MAEHTVGHRALVAVTIVSGEVGGTEGAVVGVAAIKAVGFVAEDA